MFQRLVNTCVNVSHPGLLMLAVAGGLLLACGDGGTDQRTTPDGATAVAPADGGSAPATTRTSITALPDTTPRTGPDGVPPGPNRPGGETPGATARAGGLPTSTPLPPSGLTLELVVPATATVGQPVIAQVRVTGASRGPIAAFNFELVYDESQVRLQAPVPSDEVTAQTERDFRCDQPPPSADVEPAPSEGRAQLVCFSFGDESQRGVAPPAVLATISMRALVPGTIQLRWEHVGVFAWNGTSLGTIVQRPPTLTTR